MAQWNPLHDLVSLQDRMNRLFEDATQRRASEADQSDEVEGASIRKTSALITRMVFFKSIFPGDLSEKLNESR